MAKGRQQQTTASNADHADHAHGEHAHDPSHGRGNAFMSEQLGSEHEGHDHAPHLKGATTGGQPPLSTLAPQDAQAAQATARAALESAFGARANSDNTHIVVVSGTAAMKQAYDDHYGEGDYSWDKHIVPNHNGKLGGFAPDKSTVVIDEQVGNWDTILHELLHTLVHPSFEKVAGALEEGATDMLAAQAANMAGQAYAMAYRTEADFLAFTVWITNDELADAYFDGDLSALDARASAGSYLLDFEFLAAWYSVDPATLKARFEANEAEGDEDDLDFNTEGL